MVPIMLPQVITEVKLKVQLHLQCLQISMAFLDMGTEQPVVVKRISYHRDLANMWVLRGVAALVLFFTPGADLLSQVPCDNSTEFQCGDKSCIPVPQRCDGKVNCPDSSDEKGCDHYHCEVPQWFRCKNHVCVSSAFVCDTEDDCGDNSDELNCNLWNSRIANSSTHSCTAEEWACSDRLCIPVELVCDGEGDCLDHSDEIKGCEEYDCRGFKCKNGQCISKSYRCDEQTDCNDGSDEIDCKFTVIPKNCKIEEGLFQCVDNKHCVNVSKLCDGIPDCEDKSDETTRCGAPNATCSSLKCSHNCTKTAFGAFCTCPSGYRIDNLVKCKDINECDTFGICNQRCKNTPGSYSCYCDPQYTMQADGICKVNGGEPMMLFSAKTEVRGYYLKSQLYFPVARQLKQSIGVASDGHSVFWTEVFSENECIMRAMQDGSQKQVLVDSGLGTPEDLALDWVTGNIYFTDTEMQHIGVCTNDGDKCTVLVNQGVNKPRSVVLNPQQGEMYWSDWGKRPEIARANMDGSDDIAFVKNEIYWPNGLALDLPNQRLYWADAKLQTLESIGLDGSNRRIISKGIVKHPFGLAVFENTVYWSDWSTHSIESCSKFTGKNHHILIKQSQEEIYGIHIFHSALQPRLKNPCKLTYCSDICLIKGNSSYSCACPQNKLLDKDNHTCRVAFGSERLVFGTKRTLWLLKYELLGRNNVTEVLTTMSNISAVAYNTLNNSLFVSDASSKSLLMLDLDTTRSTHLSVNGIGYIAAMDFDNVGNNLYWCDSVKANVEVLSLSTMMRITLLGDMEGETPTAMALIPKEGVMFVGFQVTNRSAHIDRFNMDGSDRRHVIERDLLGPLHLHYDAELHRVFWTDSRTGVIESTSTDGDDRHVIQKLFHSPIGITSLRNKILWINRMSRKIFWVPKVDTTNSNKRVLFGMSAYGEIAHVKSVTPFATPSHECQRNNGNCSHVCLASFNLAVCQCPMGMRLQKDKKTCYKPRFCSLDEFFCPLSDFCIPYSLRCDSNDDCLFGEDEKGCTAQTDCANGFFQCQNKECITQEMVCDGHSDCNDGSDENHCPEKKAQPPCANLHTECINEHCVDVCADGETTCKAEEFRCTSGTCIPKNWECDQEHDCPDLSDEHKDCDYAICRAPKFQCSNGICIDQELRCNKIDDCGDSSDEAFCSGKQRLVGCKSNEFRCYQNESLCLPMEVRCNGTSECPKHEDEQGCSNCDLDEFECSNKNCIPRQWVCDGVDDCGDDSDENNKVCSHKMDASSTNRTSWCDNSFRCKSGLCIDLELVCNGQDDCGDGSDEHGVCSDSCSNDNNPCSQICKKTPAGPQCHCRPGYRLRGDGHTCTDIQECWLEPPTCSQLCQEIPGSFVCSCYEGYVLRSDKKSCKSIEEGMSLIFATAHEIYQHFQTNNSLRRIHFDKTAKITGIDGSVRRGWVYFSIEETGTLHRINLNNQVWEHMKDLGQPQYLSIDWISQNVYFADDNPLSKSITLCNFESHYCTALIGFNGYEKVSALSVDAVNGYLFYSISQSKVFDSAASIIYKAHLDGSKPQVILKLDRCYITGLTYNHHKKLLFYSDHLQGSINKVQYDGGNPVEIIRNLTKPITMNVFDEHLYFYQTNGRMTVCPLFKDYAACRSYTHYNHFTEHFMIFHLSRQPHVQSACENRNCSHLCAVQENEAKCLCNSGSIMRHPCHKKQVIKDYMKTRVKEGAPSVKSGANVALSIFFVVAICVAIASVAGYYYFYKRRTGTVSVSMRFQNPVYGFLQENPQEAVICPGQHEYYNPLHSGLSEALVAKQAERKNVF